MVNAGGKLLANSEPSKPSEGGPAPSLLSDWKQIAGYFGRGVRTVQRWERDLGLPVRRIGEQRKGSVIAFVAELDDWLNQRQLRGRSVVFDEPKRVATLLQSLGELRKENQRLRRELEAERAKR
jgi:hypothetical protein